ncbi:MAG: DUF4423 domain-containing protein [Myxococcales bacterium]|nr:DUF4423 domain-containing protein [Myxococcales bacterium]
MSPHEVIAVELLRTLRGRRSQNGLSRRFGYRTNVVSRWEQGRYWPSAVRFLRGCEQLGIDVGQCYARMFQRPPQEGASSSPASGASVAAFLQELRGGTPIGQLARTAGVNRFTVSRWLKGSACPNLPQFLQIVDAASGRLPDFLSAFVDPEQLPSVRDEWRRLALLRRLAYEEPWSHAVLRALLLDIHKEGCRSEHIAEALGLSPGEVRKLLTILRKAGQVRKASSGYRARPTARVETSTDPVRARGLKAAWVRAAAERLETGAPGLFGYTLFEINRKDLERVMALQRDCARAVRAIIRDSQDTDCVGLYCVQLLDLGATPDMGASMPSHRADS